MMSLYKGIFWIKNIDNYDPIAIKELCDNMGEFLKPLPIELLSKSGEGFNHKMAWSTLNKTKTENKPYNYFARGRVEIRNGKAIIFANANIANENLKYWAIKEFGLTKENGIESILLKTDMSDHYLCYLDKEV
ncbi:MAG: hypothetical protein IJ423_03460 [Clostridia bacterium]|nr:hypothetical protein [Clostridia bacterium]